MSGLLAIISLTFLFITKRQMTRDLSRFIHRLGGGTHTAIIVWSVIFLPGTIIHEISHFLAAAFTGARTGKIEIFPEYLGDETEEKDNRTVALGYVQTQRLNPIQGFLVGTAPFVSGLALLIYLASLMQTNYQIGSYRYLLIQAYLFFTISNSFFPSWADIRQTLTFVVLAIVAALLAWFLGFQVFLSSTSQVWSIVDSLWMALTISIILNSIILFILFIGNRLLRRRTR